MVREAGRRAEQLKRFAGILAEVGAATDLRAALSALARGALSLLHGDQAAVRVYDVDGQGHHLAYWVLADGTLEPAGYPEPPPGSVAADLKAGGPARVIGDLWALDPVISPLYGELRQRGVRSSVAVPITGGGQRIGSLHIDHHEVAFFHQTDLTIAAALAGQAGVVIERARQEARLAADEATRLSERRYRALIDQSPLATLVFAPDGSAITANAAWERLWGLHLEDLVGYNILCDAQIAATGALPALQRAFSGEAVEIPPVPYDPTANGGPGRSRWVRAHCYPVKDEAGVVLEVVLVLQDVTAHQEADAALRESEARFQRLAENAPDVIYRYEVRPERRFAYVSPAMTTFSGYPPQAFYDDPELASRIVVPEDRRRATAILAGRSPIRQSVIRLRHADGHIVWAEFRRVAIPGEDGQIRAFEGVVRDVTERKVAEDRTTRLYAIATALSSALTPAQVGQVIVSEGVVALEAQSGIVGAFGDDGHTVEVLASHGYPDEAVAAWRQFRVDAQMPLAAAARTGSAVWCESRAAVAHHFPLAASMMQATGNRALAALPLIVNDRVVGVLGISFAQERTFDPDIRAFASTLAHQCAQALDRARLYAAEQQARHQAEAAIRVREEFLSVAAHELKTPMTSLRGQAQLAIRRFQRQQPVDTERMERTLRAIDIQTGKLARLIDQLLDVSRIEGGKLILERRLTDLTQLVAEVVETVQATTERHQIRCRAQAPVMAEVDPLRLEQVLINLLQNAIKYSPEGGEVDAAVTRLDEATVQLSVEDRGVGIDPQQRQWIFNRFFQAHTGGQYGGMGLGLHISKEIVDLHGGQIEPQFPADGGTRFLVTLPVRDPVTGAAQHEKRVS